MADGTDNKPRTSRANPTVRSAAVAQRRAEALRLRLAGMSSSQVAKRLGVREATVRADMKAALDQYEGELEELVPKMRAQWVARYEYLCQVFFPIATDPEAVPLDKRDAAMVVLRIGERVEKLLGLPPTPGLNMNVHVDPVAITVDNAQRHVLQLIQGGELEQPAIAAGGGDPEVEKRQRGRGIVGEILEAELDDTEDTARRTG